jgi:hypothetical protein
LKRLFRKKIKPGRDLTIDEALIITGARREIIYPVLEEDMDKARRFCSLFSGKTDAEKM